MGHKVYSLVDLREELNSFVLDGIDLTPPLLDLILTVFFSSDVSIAHRGDAVDVFPSDDILGVVLLVLGYPLVDFSLGVLQDLVEVDHDVDLRVAARVGLREVVSVHDDALVDRNEGLGQLVVPGQHACQILPLGEDEAGLFDHLGCHVKRALHGFFLPVLEEVLVLVMELVLLWDVDHNLAEIDVVLQGAPVGHEPVLVEVVLDFASYPGLLVLVLSLLMFKVDLVFVWLILEHLEVHADFQDSFFKDVDWLVVNDFIH